MPRSPEPARQALISAAERLFAERGVDAVPVGDVARAAGQRNNSAVQYHFGDKQGLVQAVVDKHQECVDAQRVELLDRLDAKASVTLRDVVDVLVQPLACLLDDPDGRHFLQIQAQLLAIRDISGGWARRRGAKRMIALLSEVGGDLEPHGAHRRALVTTLLFHGLADFARRRPRASASERKKFTGALTDSVVAVIGARAAA